MKLKKSTLKMCSIKTDNETFYIKSILLSADIKDCIKLLRNYSPAFCSFHQLTVYAREVFNQEIYNQKHMWK